MSLQSQYSHYEWHPGCPSLQIQTPDLSSLRLLGCWLAPHFHSPHHTLSTATNTWSGLGGWGAYPLQISWGPIYFCLQTGGIKYVIQAQINDTIFMKNFNSIVKIVYQCWIGTWSCWLHLQSSPQKCRCSCQAPQLSGLLLPMGCLLWPAPFPTSCSL